MKPSKLIAIVYRKELTDILRDRRTLVAMVLIPVVLYPVLMLGVVWATQMDEKRLRAEHFVLEVDNTQTRDDVEEIIKTIEESRGLSDEPTVNFDVQIGHTPEAEIGEKVQLHVSIVYIKHPEPLPMHMEAELIYNEVNVRSRTAMEQFSDILNEFRQLVTRECIARILAYSLNQAPSRLDIDVILNPLKLSTHSPATPDQRGGWALGQIIPFILVLMTITGAVYPAIDLTAGERERGTLETLMATPVSTFHLIVGKFLVVATIGMVTALLNLASVGATMHFGGVTRALAAEMPVAFPVAVLPIILLCMIPFALLFSAILVAVCSFARTFKEAQNYVMPIIIGAMIPSMLVTMPTVRLEGAIMVLPVGNMVLLTRELFQQTCSWTAVVVVLLSTSLYAVAAIAVAAKLFGQEAVLFIDTGSYKTLFSRRLFRPVLRPSVSQALLAAAILFPVSFHAQAWMFSDSTDHFVDNLKWVAIVQFAGLFVALPVALSFYLKIDVIAALQLRLPPLRAWLAATLLGISSWALAHELLLLQPASEAMIEFSRAIEPQLARSPLWLVLILLAIAPAVSEELFFRGFLLSGLSASLRKWPAIVACALIFGVFHFMVERIPLTALMGIALGYVCWQSRSILPGIFFHACHNAWPMVFAKLPDTAHWLGMVNTSGEPTHLRIPVIIAAVCTFLLGLLIVFTINQNRLDAHMASRRSQRKGG